MLIFKILVFFLLLLGWLSGDQSFSSSLEAVLQAPHLKALQKTLHQTQQIQKFKQLCDFQKRNQKLPYACYKISQDWPRIDPWCLKLKAQHLNLKILQKYSQMQEISPNCRQHLKARLKLLEYQKLDLILFPIKNHWTDKQNVF